MTDVERNDSFDRPTPPLPPPLPEPPSGGTIAPSPAGESQKSPPLAAVLSFILPGLGHLYAGSQQRAGMLLASFVLAILLATVTWPFIFLCIFLWFFGMFDAYRDAQLFNLGEAEREVRASQDGGKLLFGAFLLLGGLMLLLDKFDVIDFDRFFRAWWPALVVAAGLYFVIGALRERRRRSE